MFAEDDLAVGEMLHQARLQPVQADKAKPAHDPLGGRQRGEMLLIPKPVLQSEHDGVRPDQRR